jgi:hypothetical protein
MAAAGIKEEDLDRFRGQAKLQSWSQSGWHVC